MKFDFKIAVLMLLAVVPAQPLLAQQPPVSSRPDYSKFSLITSRNIFDPSRYGRTSRSNSSTPRQYDSLTLVGTMIYDKGPYAFFDGSSSSFRKVAHDSEKVADFTVHDITPDEVKLSGTNDSHFALHVGMQLRKYLDGSWHLVSSPELMPLSDAQTSGVEMPQKTVVQTEGTNVEVAPDLPMPLSTDMGPMPPPDEPPPGNATNAPPDAPGANGETDPVLLRLMQRRQQENQ